MSTPGELGAYEIFSKEKIPCEETDVVVAGAGIAGLAAAIKASERGAKVIVLDKLEHTIP